MPPVRDRHSPASSLGEFLSGLRGAKGMTLREVEEATGREVSNAYLSQLENSKIAKPSPHILHTLSQVYGVSYERLMEKAGYVVGDPPSRKSKEHRHGRVAALSIEDFTPEEEEQLLKYAAFLRSQRKRT
ncbi:helix-turn-helix domain-containing protein [Roseomonas mucosa]|uniref:helix-turn-helix domain-containing protein n=1 Tax=Roseomonas mucosa TaxID=207340 RepID=UPI00224597E3|nr:helix-turn-helix domain-containing protein [Roseomonas mucosa]UZO94601.1 Transcriptional regulator [Roseomonas mucosa]